MAWHFYPLSALDFRPVHVCAPPPWKNPFSSPVWVKRCWLQTHCDCDETFYNCLKETRDKHNFIFFLRDFFFIKKICLFIFAFYFLIFLLTFFCPLLLRIVLFLILSPLLIRICFIVIQFYCKLYVAHYFFSILILAFFIRSTF